MKHACCFVLLATLGFSVTVMANQVSPSVTGTVTRVTPVGNERQVTVNGHTYTIKAATIPGGTTATLQAGQQVTLFLSSDGSTVITAVPASNSAPTHP